jgi:DNA-binding protein YbaB
VTEYRAQVDELLAGYRRSREHLATVHQQLAAISASASSDDGSVTATVGPRGTLTGLTITDEAYRTYRPSELAAQIMRATAAASAAALADASEVIAPALPPDTDPQAVLLGTGDLAPRELQPEPAAVRPSGEDDDDFDERSWLAR